AAVAAALSLHDALPIYPGSRGGVGAVPRAAVVDVVVSAVAGFVEEVWRWTERWDGPDPVCQWNPSSRGGCGEWGSPVRGGRLAVDREVGWPRPGVSVVSEQPWGCGGSTPTRSSWRLQMILQSPV